MKCGHCASFVGENSLNNERGGNTQRLKENANREMEMSQQKTFHARNLITVTNGNFLEANFMIKALL